MCRKPKTLARRSRESLKGLDPPIVEPLVRGLVIFCGRFFVAEGTAGLERLARIDVSTEPILVSDRFDGIRLSWPHLSASLLMRAISSGKGGRITSGTLPEA
jgi:hypothetical protein